MQHSQRHRSPLVRRLGLVFFLLCLFPSSVFAAQSAPMARAPLRLLAQGRWEQRPFADYRITVRVESQGRTCFQDVEVRSGRNVVSRDSCRTFWLASLTVERLFTLSTRLERPPECAPSVQPCACQRVRLGSVTFDNQLGFPAQMTLQRWVGPNIGHIDFWRHLFAQHAMPPCNDLGVAVRLTVVAVTPLV